MQNLSMLQQHNCSKNLRHSSSNSNSRTALIGSPLAHIPRLSQSQRSGQLHKPCTVAWAVHDPASSTAATAAGAAGTSSSSGSSQAANASPTPAAPAAAASSRAGATDWEARRKQRVVNDLVDASKRLGPAYTHEAIQSGVQTLETLLPGLQIDIELLKASDWAKLVVSVKETANRIVLLKTLYPRADLTAIVQRMPSALLWSAEELQENAIQVKQLLADAKDLDALITNLPSLLEPRTLISVLVTVRKWYFNKRDPVEVLEADPDLVRRAQECDMPWEPVYTGEDGKLMAPSLDYHNKRADWQAYIDRTFYKQE